MGNGEATGLIKKQRFAAGDAVGEFRRREREGIGKREWLASKLVED